MKYKGFLLWAVLLLAASCTVGGTLSYLMSETREAVNTFLPGYVPPVVEEQFDGYKKQNVTIRNDGNTPAYIRSYVSVHWIDAQGHISPEVPVSEQDYRISWWEEGWEKAGEYYYCLNPVAPQETTPVLIREFTQEGEKEGYTMVVEILAQTVQAQGTDSLGRTPAELAWQVRFENGRFHVLPEEGSVLS